MAFYYGKTVCKEQLKVRAQKLATEEENILLQSTISLERKLNLH